MALTNHELELSENTRSLGEQPGRRLLESASLSLIRYGAAGKCVKQTPLNAAHRRLGAKMVDFGGWDLPVQYSGVLDEHRAVRRDVGLFDVSHMGEIKIHRPEALRLVNYAATNDASKLARGQAHYSALLYAHVGFVDDIVVHKVADDRYFLCINASNQDKDCEHLASRNKFDCRVGDGLVGRPLQAAAGSQPASH